jgi:hypothetical protein
MNGGRRQADPERPAPDVGGAVPVVMPLDQSRPHGVKASILGVEPGIRVTCVWLRWIVCLRVQLYRLRHEILGGQRGGFEIITAVTVDGNISDNEFYPQIRDVGANRQYFDQSNLAVAMLCKYRGPRFVLVVAASTSSLPT